MSYINERTLSAIAGKLILILIILLVVLCVYCAFSGCFMMINLKKTMEKMQNSKMNSYPEKEIPLQLRRKPDKEDLPKGLTPWEASLVNSSHSNRIRLDVEEEKKYPYYKRTHNVISNVYKYSDLQLQNHSWYGYDEWIQDMTANKIEEQILVGNEEQESK